MRKHSILRLSWSSVESTWHFTVHQVLFTWKSRFILKAGLITELSLNLESIQTCNCSSCFCAVTGSVLIGSQAFTATSPSAVQTWISFSLSCTCIPWSIACSNCACLSFNWPRSVSYFWLTAASSSWTNEGSPFEAVMASTVCCPLVCAFSRFSFTSSNCWISTWWVKKGKQQRIRQE